MEFAVKPIARSDLSRVNLRCLPDGGRIEKLFDQQGTIGIAAWENNKCVGTLWFYAVAAPDFTNLCCHPLGGWRETDWKTPLLRGTSASDKGKCLGLSCFHVGRTMQTIPSDEPDPSYFGKGIGRALCQEALTFARKSSLSAVLAHGGPHQIRSYAVWAGQLPTTAYQKLGFRILEHVSYSKRHERTDVWDCPPFVHEEIGQALADGIPEEQIAISLVAREFS